jgi:hypothetical protein
MSLDLANSLRVLLSSAPARLRTVPVVQLSHSAMTRSYYLWREPYVGSVTTELGVQTVEPLNFEIKLPASESNLDQQFDITLDTTDIADTLRTELARIPLDTTERVQLIYREYISDDLSSIVARSVLQVESIAYKLGAATLSAVSRRLNTHATGKIYSSQSIPMLRGF